MTDEAGKTRPLDDLDARLRAARAGDKRGSSDGDGPDGGGGAKGAGPGLAARMVVELVAGVAVGSAIGYGLDRWLGTRPWLMVVFLFLGAAASVVNMYRAAQGLDDGVGLERARRRRDGGG
jgi:ATP synthase protein I